MQNNTTQGKPRYASITIGATVLLASSLMAGCSDTSPTRHAQMPYEPVYPANIPVAEQPRNGSLFQATAETSMFNDLKAHRIGDIITVKLSENTKASKKASANTSKNSNLNVANPTFMGQPFSANSIGVPSLDAQLSSGNSFAGSGDAAQSNSFNGEISVTVHEVLNNGYLIVRGEKWVTINQGEEVMRFSGIVRPADIEQDNTIQSSKVADARIYYSGTGTLQDAQRQGILTGFFNKFWPI